MPLIPKEGTIERIVLDKLIENEGGITYLDFPEHLNITEELLEQAVTNLQTGIFESEDDVQIKFDS